MVMKYNNNINHTKTGECLKECRADLLECKKRLLRIQDYLKEYYTTDLEVVYTSETKIMRTLRLSYIFHNIFNSDLDYTTIIRYAYQFQNMVVYRCIYEDEREIYKYAPPFKSFITS
mgnify:FL=1